MRICFLADSSSIHTQRLVAYYVRSKDDVLVLSTAATRSDIPGANTIYLLASNPRAGQQKTQRSSSHPTGVVKALKRLIPRFIKAASKRTMRALRLAAKVTVCQQKISQFNADVIYCFRSFPEGLLAMCSRVRPLLLRTAGPDISKLPRYPVYRQLIRKILRSADLVVTESIAERQLLSTLCGGRLRSEVEIIGIDTDLFRPPESRAKLRERYGVPPDAFVVLSNRYLEGHYNGWMVVEALQSLIERHPAIHLLYVNPSPMGQSTSSKAESIARRCSQIMFLNGPIPHREMPNVLGCGDIYVSFSSFDGVPNSLLEAMACGLVPIVADLPQLREWVEDGRTGYLVPQCRIDVLAATISRLYAKRQDLTGFRRRCVSKIREAGCYEKCSERTRNLLLQLGESGFGAWR